ncbi:hypothetical protein QOZ80_4BG0348820 [Eleusine coracana subsp. coracana]|nr:hypothetical protein QOZ80_4BG0348820 [Eleusine coracana subsp. coracana]
MKTGSSSPPPQKESRKRKRTGGRKAKREELKKGKGRRDGASPETSACLAREPRKHLLCSMSPSLPDDLIPDILLRVPPDDPAGLVRASAVCKAWRRIVTDLSFSTRYRAIHRTAPVLGFLHNPMEQEARRFVPTTSFRLPTPDHPMRHVWDCRHGRVLLYDYDMRSPTPGFVVWDPITGDRHRIPEVADMYTNGAVVCTAGGGCDHRSCSGGPFIVAFAGVEHINVFGDINYLDAHAEFYSSETRNRGLNINIHLEYEKFDLEVDRPAVLVGDSLYFVCKSGFLLRYWYGPLLQLGYKKMLEAGIYSSEIVTVIEPPKAKNLGKVIAMMAEDGGLGLASLRRNKISLWARKTGMDGHAGWVRHRTIDLKRLLPLSNPKRQLCLSGVIPENANVIFVSTEDGVFTIDLKSSQSRKVSEMGNDVKIIYPFVSFYTETLLQRLPSSTLPASEGKL